MKMFKDRKIYIFFILFSLLYLTFGIVSGVFLGWRAADVPWILVISKHVPSLDVYSHYMLPDLAPPKGVGFGYPPLLLFLYFPFFVLGAKFGWLNEFSANIATLPLLLIDIVNVYLIVDLISSIKRRVSEKKLILIILLLFFSGYFSYSSGLSGHPETLVLFLSLLGLRLLKKRRVILAGCLFGLALLAKQVAIFIFIPVFFGIIFSHKGIRSWLKFGISAILTFALVTLPFFLKDFSATWSGIIGFNQSLKIYGPNIWWLLSSISKSILNYNTQDVLGKIANPVLFGLVILASYYFVKIRKVTLLSIDFFGLIALIFFIFSIFMKWLWFRHFLPVFVFFLIWDALKNKDSFPTAALTYGFIFLSANFLGDPLWQLESLFINMGFSIYILREMLVSNWSN